MSFVAHTQIRSVDGVFSPDINAIYPQKNIETFDKRERKLEFSSSVSKDWIPAELVSMNQSVITDYNLRYDTYNKIIYLNRENEVHIIPITYIQSFTLKVPQNERVFVKRFIEVEDEFFEELHSGEWTLLKRFESQILKSTYKPALDVGNINDKVIVKEVYFIENSNGLLLKIPKSNKKAILFFYGLNTGAKNFISKNKLNLKDQDDLIKILKFLNN